MNKLNCIIVCLFLTAGCLFEVQGQTKDTIVEEDGIFIVAEVMPEFPGGEQALMKFLQDNVKYPEKIGEADIAGRVLVQFVVEKDGSLTDVKVIKSLAPPIDEEAIRVIKLMPKWKPATQKGNPVRMWHRLPIHINLQ